MEDLYMVFRQGMRIVCQMKPGRRKDEFEKWTWKLMDHNGRTHAQGEEITVTAAIEAGKRSQHDLKLAV